MVQRGECFNFEYLTVLELCSVFPVWAVSLSSIAAIVYSALAHGDHVFSISTFLLQTLGSAALTCMLSKENRKRRQKNVSRDSSDDTLELIR